MHKKWNPETMMAHKHPIVKARVQAGGESGTVAVFIALDDVRFVYGFQNIDAGMSAIDALVAQHPERFPLRRTSASETRAVYKRLSRQL